MNFLNIISLRHYLSNNNKMYYITKIQIFSRKHTHAMPPRWTGSRRPAHPGGSADGDRSSPYVAEESAPAQSRQASMPAGLPPKRALRQLHAMQMPQPQAGAGEDQASLSLRLLGGAPVQRQADRTGKEEGALRRAYSKFWIKKFYYLEVLNKI